jgi:hypothetical protein
MRVLIPAKRLRASGRVGPMCLACGNTRRFSITDSLGTRTVELADLAEGPVEIAGCGKCGSRHCIVVCRVD